MIGAEGGSRTHTTLRSTDFKSVASAIPPPRRRFSDKIACSFVFTLAQRCQMREPVLGQVQAHPHQCQKPDRQGGQPRKNSDYEQSDFARTFTIAAQRTLLLL